MKILIIGASGYLGNTIYKKLKKLNKDDVFGTCYKQVKDNLMKVDVLNRADLEGMLKLKPDVIIWTIFDKEREKLFSEIGLNYIAKNMEKDVRFIYVSTTVGMGRNQTEEVEPHIRSKDEYLYKYINGKIEGENIVKRLQNYVIVRPGSIYGYDYDGKMDCRMRELLEISESGSMYIRTANMYSSYVNIMGLADAIIELVYNKFSGIINISGEEPVSYYKFYKYLAKLLNINDSFIIEDLKKEDMYHNLNNNLRKTILKCSIDEI